MKLAESCQSRNGDKGKLCKGDATSNKALGVIVTIGHQQKRVDL